MRRRDAVPTDVPEITRFFDRLGIHFPGPNLEQFVRPSRPAEDLAVVTRLVLGKSDEIVGLLGYLERPLRVDGRQIRGRWPVNFFLAPELRGQGLGKDLMRDVMGGCELGLVLGGNPKSIPVLERTGWRRLGDLHTYEWQGRASSFSTQNRARPGLPATTPWAEGSGRNGVRRDGVVLSYRFAGPLAPYHRVFHVVDEGTPTGYFVLSMRRDGPAPGRVKITDFDASPGTETQLARAALATAFDVGSEVEAHACNVAFRSAFETLSPTRAAVGLPIWVLDPHDLLTAASSSQGTWHITHGDHDRYRRWTDSVTFCALQENPEPETVLQRP